MKDEQQQKTILSKTGRLNKDHYSPILVQKHKTLTNLTTRCQLLLTVETLLASTLSAAVSTSVAAASLVREKDTFPLLLLLPQVQVRAILQLT